MSDAIIAWLISPGRGEQLPTPDLLLGRPSWHTDALCRGQGAALFVRGAKADYGRLREVCAVCPVREECLEVALADPELQGLWGGATDAERRQMRRVVA